MDDLRLITVRDITSNLAKCAVQCSPRVWTHCTPDNFQEALREAERWLLGKGGWFIPVLPMKWFSWAELDKLIDEMVHSVPQIRLWNLTRTEVANGVKEPHDGIAFVSAYDSGSSPDHDFIDLGALSKNTFMAVWADNDPMKDGMMWPGPPYENDTWEQ